MAHVDADDDVGAAVLAALRAIADRLDEIEPAALADEADAVHRLRTTVRRLRSVLVVYRPLLEASSVDEVRRRYRTLGRRLGSVRDVEVRLLVAEEALQDAASSGFFDPVVLVRVTAGIVAETTESHQLALRRFVQHERLPGAARRRAALDDLLAQPFGTRREAAARPPLPPLSPLLAREARRTATCASGVDASSAPARLHAMRKAARRLRYAAEALAEGTGVNLGGSAQRLAAAGERIQDVLGDHRDQLLFAEYLRRAASVAARPDEERSVLQGLAVAAERRAAQRVADLEPAVRELRGAERGRLAL
ncbi:CHAD domain-containing protein [Agromyces cerinus]|uniref:CHAD domain-containing protein n=1 Tax=Agromyces cerinus subsp. cerinus TaxID=232089 RepID=A0A1N6E931_9MICO|nr:CHAD domain-containing protein [Agromyces cerinus]SIN79503.1 CHAD domain-containing protein [Agromyces cerinus subsp. cerinus]